MHSISRGPTLKEQIYEFIRERIVWGHYLPGQTLSESEIAQELAVSRTPVSAALTSLVERGLLEQRTGKFAIPTSTLR